MTGCRFENYYQLSRAVGADYGEVTVNIAGGASQTPECGCVLGMKDVTTGRKIDGSTDLIEGPLEKTWARARLVERFHGSYARRVLLFGVHASDNHWESG